MIQEWIGILSTKRTLIPQTTVRVAASDASGPPIRTDPSRRTDGMSGNRGQKRQVTSAAPEGAKHAQSSTRCNICGSAHVTEKCAALLQLSLDERVKKLYDHRVCYHCLEKHHIAKFCKNKPKCGICSKPHHTILHGQAPHPTLSVNASSFVPATYETAAPAGHGGLQTPITPVSFPRPSAAENSSR